MSSREEREEIAKRLTKAFNKTDWITPLTPAEKVHFNRIREAEKRSAALFGDDKTPIN